MGFPKSDEEKAFLDAQFGVRWNRMLSNGQIFNWFVDYVSHEAKMERDRIIKRLRVFASRNEAPTALWAVLLGRFFEEGAHLGLRKYVEQGVTYHCPPQFFSEFKALCVKVPSFRNTAMWVYKPDSDGSGRIYAHVLAPGIKNWFRKTWPDVLKFCGRRCSVFYYPAGSVHELENGEGEEDVEEGIEHFRNCFSVLCLMFKTTSPAAFDISMGRYAKQAILEILDDPYLSVSKPGFNNVAQMVAGMCTKDFKPGKPSALRDQVLRLLSSLATNYSHLKEVMKADADYMYMLTYPLMPLSKKSAYGAVMADFESGMKAIVTENFDEVIASAKKLTGEDEENDLHFFAEVEPVGEPEDCSHELIRKFLADSYSSAYMAVEGFDVLYQASGAIEGEASEEIHGGSLKELMRHKFKKLSDAIENEGEFLVTGPLMLALKLRGEARIEEGATDYGDLLFRRDADSPWVRLYVKFASEALDLEETRAEFMAYCRIVNGQ